MKTSPNSQQTSASIVELIASAGNAELCRDISTLQEILQPLINSHDCLNSFEEYDAPVRAELLRLYGFYLTFEGRAKNKRDFHLKAKDLVTVAIGVFEDEGIYEKVAESKITLAFCYWNNSELDEADALFDMLEMEFAENKFHPVYLQLKINQIMLFWWIQKYEEAFEIVAQINTAVQLCADFRLRIMFHIETGNLSHHAGKFELAESYYVEAIRLAKKHDHRYFLAVIYNNYSFLLSDQGKFEQAHFYSEKSLEIFNKINHTGWIPHVLDTRASIYLAEGQQDQALELIEKSLGYFGKSDDFYGHIGSLWTKCKILFSLDRNIEALMIYGELQAIAAERIGRTAVEKYAKLLNREIYALRETDYENEVSEFKKFLVTRALRAANGKRTEAARLLGFEKHQRLSNILENQFPTLFEDLGYTERRTRSDKSKPKKLKDGLTVISPQNDKNKRKSETGKKSQKEKKVIARLDLGGKMLSFPWKFEAEKYTTFYFSASLMRYFRIEEDALVVVAEVEEVAVDSAVVLLDGDRYVFGKTRYDSFSSLFYLEWEGETIFITAENVVGIPAAYQSMAKTKDDVIEFIKI